jgi:hypothetical protein
MLTIILLCLQDLGACKQDLTRAIDRSDAPQAQAAIDGLAALRSAAAVDALLSAAGQCRLMNRPAILDRILDALVRCAGVPRIEERFKTCGDPVIRAGLVPALGEEALVDTLSKEREPAIKVALLDALGEKKRSVDVARFLNPREAWQVQAAALKLIRSTRSLDAVEALIEGLSKAEGRLELDYHGTLVALTGVDKGVLPASWKAWWQQNQAAVRSGTYVPREDERGGRNKGTAFFGVPVLSRRAVFVLDHSGSMSGAADFEDGRKRKIDAAREQLKQALRQMPDGALVNVVFYETAFQAFRDRLVTLSASSRQELFAYIDSLEPKGSTNVFDSLERALSYGADTIYLLSDGMPNKGRFTRPDDICVQIQKINRPLHVAIHTILIRSRGGGSAEELMKRLARENDGIFKALGR